MRWLGDPGTFQWEGQRRGRRGEGGDCASSRSTYDREEGGRNDDALSLHQIGALKTMQRMGATMGQLEAEDESIRNRCNVTIILLWHSPQHDSKVIKMPWHI